MRNPDLVINLKKEKTDIKNSDAQVVINDWYPDLEINLKKEKTDIKNSDVQVVISDCLSYVMPASKQSDKMEGYVSTKPLFS